MISHGSRWIRCILHARPVADQAGQRLTARDSRPSVRQAGALPQGEGSGVPAKLMSEIRIGNRPLISAKR